MENKPFNAFIGRFQPAHLGHKFLFDTYLNEGKPVLIMIRDVPRDEKNPLSARDVYTLWKKIYQKEISSGLVEVMIIPDIASVNYGRSVGWTINEIKVESNIASISATDIRNKIKSGDDSWKGLVDPVIHEDLIRLLS